MVHNMSYWPPHEGPKLWHDPFMRKLKKGRPNNTSTTTEIYVVEKTPRKCGLCRKSSTHQVDQFNIYSIYVYFLLCEIISYKEGKPMRTFKVYL